MTAPWRVARSLLVLREQVNALAPKRAKDSDGAIGDQLHASRASDHNPWVKDGLTGVVTAIDITNDPLGGCDAGKLAEALRAAKDPRLKYCIWNRRIASKKWGLIWRPYIGANPHDHHVHISVEPMQALYDSDAPWKIA